ncbi:MAG: hypothetical protein GX175_08665 [Halanaerobiaceae bacterium]|nr:hypothetical protein [Halanaerobiaceae bacterium]
MIMDIGQRGGCFDCRKTITGKDVLPWVYAPAVARKMTGMLIIAVHVSINTMRRPADGPRGKDLTRSVPNAEVIWMGIKQYVQPAWRK